MKKDKKIKEEKLIQTATIKTKFLSIKKAA